MERDTFAVETAYGWEDRHGIIAPFRPGVGPRTNPLDEFPSGPGIGETLPTIAGPSTHGPIDLESFRNGRRAVVVVFRSAVW